VHIDDERSLFWSAITFLAGLVLSGPAGSWLVIRDERTDVVKLVRGAHDAAS
jgi:hypothetical protein